VERGNFGGPCFKNLINDAADNVAMGDTDLGSGCAVEKHRGKRGQTRAQKHEGGGTGGCKIKMWAW